MEDALLYDRLQFAFTITYHYLFPQLTMGLALIIVIYKALYLKTDNILYNNSAKFWAKIFAINFGMGVITGIPMEFQFGTNWATFSDKAGGVIGQTLAMEGMFSFFLESSFLGLFLFGEKILGKKLHFLAAFLVFLGAWASGYLIIATHSWMQNPVGYEILANGKFVLTHFFDLFSNPWLLPSFFHNQMASLVTASFVIGSVGAYYLLIGKNKNFGHLFLKTAIITGVISTISLAFPTGDLLAKQVAQKQPVTLAGMEGLFNSIEGAPIALIGQPNMKTQRLDNKIEVPNVLSFLTYKRWDAKIQGLNDFPKEQWPTNIPGLYYSYHIMVGLGTVFIGIMILGLWFLWKKKLEIQRWFLWILLFTVPFPYIANTAGWYTAELGRQPYLIYGLFKTSEGISENVSSGNTLFTFLGFVGLYLLLGFIALILVGKTIHNGPTSTLKTH